MNVNTTNAKTVIRVPARVNVNTTDATTGATGTALLLPVCAACVPCLSRLPPVFWVQKHTRPGTGKTGQVDSTPRTGVNQHSLPKVYRNSDSAGRYPSPFNWGWTVV